MSKERERLEQELLELHKNVSKLEAKLKEVVESEQHEAVDHLEDYICAVEGRMKILRVFLKELFTGNAS